MGLISVQDGVAPGGGAGFVYVGAGTPAPAATQAYSSKIALNAGDLMTLQGYIDATEVAGIALRSPAQTAQVGASSTISIAKPSGVVSGDVLYAFVAGVATSATTITPPAGWTSIGSTTLALSGGQTALLQVFRRISDGTDGASYGFSFSVAQSRANGAVIAYAGVNGSTPEDAAPIFTTGSASADGEVAVDAITTASVGARVLLVVIDPLAASTPVPAATAGGFDEQWLDSDAVNGQTTVGFDYMQAQPNSLATVDFDGFLPNDWFLGVMLALKPANTFPQWLATDPSRTTVYAAAQQAPGIAGTVVASFSVPAGVTDAVVVADVNECVVVGGANLVLANPQLEDGSDATEWEEVTNSPFTPETAISFPGSILDPGGWIDVENPISFPTDQAQFVISAAPYAGTFKFDFAWQSGGQLDIMLFSGTANGYLFSFNNLAGAPMVQIYRIAAGVKTLITNNNLSGTQLTGMPGNLASTMAVGWNHCSIEYEATGLMRVHVGAVLQATADDNTYAVDGPIGYGYEVSQCGLNHTLISTAANNTPMPDPTSLAAAVLHDFTLELTWDFPKPHPKDFSHFEIWVNTVDSLAGATFVEQTKQLKWKGGEVAPGSNWYFVTAVNKADYPDLSPPSVLAVLPAIPDVTSLAAVVTHKSDLLLSWTGVTPFTGFASYEVRKGSSWAGGSLVHRTKQQHLLITDPSPGTTTYWVGVETRSGFYDATPPSVTATVPAIGDVSNLTAAITHKNDLKLAWTKPATLPTGFSAYEIRSGSTWAGGTLVDRIKKTNYLIVDPAPGSTTYWVGVLDRAGNYDATPPSVVATLGAIGDVTGLTATITHKADVKLSWTPPTLPAGFDAYEIRSGSTWAGGTLVNRTKKTFYVIADPPAGSTTYWVGVLDKAGNYDATPPSVTAAVNAGANALPDVTSLAATVTKKQDILLTWSCALPTGFGEFEIRSASTNVGWASAAYLHSTKQKKLLITDPPNGTVYYWVGVKDRSGHYDATPPGVTGSIAAGFTLDTVPDGSTYIRVASVGSDHLVQTGSIEPGAVIGPGENIWSGSWYCAPTAGTWSVGDGSSTPSGVWSAYSTNPNPSIVSCALSVHAATDPITGHLLLDLSLVDFVTNSQIWIQIVDDLGNIVAGPTKLDIAYMGGYTSLDLNQAGGHIKFSDTAGSRTYTAQLAVYCPSGVSTSVTITRADLYLEDKKR